MTDNLIDYLKKSREGRRELVKKAEEIVKPHFSNTLSVPVTGGSDFPMPNPQRLMDFKEKISINLQKIFKPEKNLKKKVQVLRSVSKEDDYKKIYMKNYIYSKYSNKSRSGNYSVQLENLGKKIVPRQNLKEKYLVPLFANKIN